ncbi:protein BCL9 homolog [Musca autumnalis]|uniref:protein BCL9 homolog n=1 Tax=Musca autumnalis TaxID=221902 RepID=UPI003CF5988A
MMDINKRMQGLDESNVRQTSEMPNFPESQFSDTSNNSGNSGLQQSTGSNNNNNNNSPCEEESVSFPKTESSPMVPTSDGDVDNLGNSNSSGHNITSPNSKNMNKTNPNAPMTKAGSDEKDIKEETTLSPPHTSPLAKNNDDNDESQERAKSVGAAMTGSVNPNMEGVNTNMSPKSNPDVFNAGPNMQNLPRGLNPYNNANNNKFNYPNQGGPGGVVGGGENQGPMNPANNNGLSGGSGGGGGDYLQHQNHVFVFSTQLANKGAEAVVSGQFPTIIAYHCMQPSTKLFLEDFLKNPAKASKMQKQIPPNIMNLMQSGMMGNRPGAQPFWLNDGGNNPGKMSHRPPGSLRNAGVNKNSPGWEQTAGLDSKMGPSANPLDLLGNPDGFDSAQMCGGGGLKDDDKSQIPSLQGVKVPDENLTPQQRQHREEQLAKLKKMNKFLFPENEGNDFQPPPLMNSSGGPEGSACTNNPANPIDSMNNPMNTGKLATPGSGTNMGDDVPPTGVNSGDPMALGGPGQNSKQGCASKLNPNMNSLKPNTTGPDSNPDMPSSFNMNNCPPLEGDTGGHGGVPPGMNMPNEEWSKFQNNVFPDGFKFRDNSNPMNNPSGLPGNQLPNQPQSLPRPLSTGVGGYGMPSRPNAGPSPTNRNNNGPPPPYHQTQRSASVPISTQSPTQPNLNNPNADIGLTSPHGGRVPFGMSSTPPHMDSSNTSSTVTNPSHSTATSFPGLNSGNAKNMYSSNLNSSQGFGGPQNPAALNNMSNSPGSLSLPHMPHGEMDPMNSGNKMKRGSPQKSKSPMINEMPGNMGMDSKYGNFGLNYNMCGGGGVGGGNMPHVGPQNMRQNMGQMPPQFCRRIDNIPLNPNCNRLNQNKPVGNFDPIASLAQMSQQLTGSAMGLGSLGGGGGSGGNSSASGLMDVNSGDMMGGPSGRGDHPLDHCNQMPNNNMGMPGLGGGGGRPGPYGSDPMNSMDAMDQRMLNGKMCLPGHFNHNPLTGVGLRDGNMGGNDMMSANRAMNRRMPNNFDNFNMSSNVHVRASAPNTIQYMPAARSQNMNNMRMPMEFFQRYGNPHGNQMGGGGMGNAPGGGGMPNNDMSNPNMMNLFGNCGQMPPNGRGGGPGGPVGFEPNDLGVEGNLMHNDAPYMNVP